MKVVVDNIYFVDVWMTMDVAVDIMCIIYFVDGYIILLITLHVYIILVWL